MALQITQRGVQLAVLAAVVLAAAQAANTTVNGYLVDKACSQELAAKGKQALAQHDRSCSLMDACAESGYGVVTDDGKFIAFDAAGNKRALAAIKAAKKDADFKVTVTGEQQGPVLKVASLKLD
jgi:hypothetical protein